MCEKRWKKSKKHDVKAVENAGRQERKQVAVVIEILRRREASVRPATREEKDNDDLRMEDTEAAREKHD